MNVNVIILNPGHKTPQLQEHKMKKVALLTTIFCLVFSVSAFAANKNVWDMANSDKYGEKAGGMLLRGLLNVASSPIDMPVQAVKGAQKNKPEFIGAVGGFASGAVCTILRASSGIIDVTTSWVPGFHGLPVSRSYENCLDFGDEPKLAKPSRYTPPPAPRMQQAAPQPVRAQTPPPAQDSRSKYIKK
jgi:putative exosortase-associated protein (TIGR04073 family)